MNWVSRSQDTQITFSLDIAYQNLTSTNPPAARYNGFQQLKPYPAMKGVRKMEQNLIRPSTNGFDFLEFHLTELFGERGGFRHNLERYHRSPEFHEACRFPSSIDEIPELTVETIHAQIERENFFQRQCQQVLSIYDQRSRDGTMTKEDYYEIAGIMGLCPGRVDWCDTLFPHLLDLFVSSDEEGQKLWDHAWRLPNIV